MGNAKDENIRRGIRFKMQQWSNSLQPSYYQLSKPQCRIVIFQAIDKNMQHIFIFRKHIQAQKYRHVLRIDKFLLQIAHKYVCYQM